jgi:flavodoxin
MAHQKILVVYSSKTGNTRKLAEGIAGGLNGWDGNEAAALSVEEEAETGKAGAADVVFAGFWVDKGNADQKALGFLSGLSGKKIGLFGTLGAYPDSAHAKETAEKVKAAAAGRNICLGCFLCQGKIDPALTERFKQFPPGHPHAMTEERAARHAEAAKHPDQADIEAAVNACRDMLGRT